LRVGEAGTLGIAMGHRVGASLRQSEFMGGNGVQPGWQKLGGIGEIGLWCGLGSGKRRNRIYEDGTGQEGQVIAEGRRQAELGIGCRAQMEVSGMVSIRTRRRFGVGMMAAIPISWEVEWLLQNGTQQRWLCLTLNTGIKLPFMLLIFRRICLCFDCVKPLKYVEFYQNYTWRDIGTHGSGIWVCKVCQCEKQN